jgi:hypothetical protein
LCVCGGGGGGGVGTCLLNKDLKCDLLRVLLTWVHRIFTQTRFLLASML